jgi:hypothetical protein
VQAGALVDRDALNVAVAGLRLAQQRVDEQVELSHHHLPLRLAAAECCMWLDCIREELGISARSLTVVTMPWTALADCLHVPVDAAARQRAVELIHGVRWARKRHRARPHRAVPPCRRRDEDTAGDTYGHGAG